MATASLMKHVSQTFLQATASMTWAWGYQVVAITGPQSSGKSTLMNAVVSLLANSHQHTQCIV